MSYAFLLRAIGWRGEQQQPQGGGGVPLPGGWRGRANPCTMVLRTIAHACFCGFKRQLVVCLWISKLLSPRLCFESAELTPNLPNWNRFHWFGFVVHSLGHCTAPTAMLLLANCVPHACEPRIDSFSLLVFYKKGGTPVPHYHSVSIVY